MSSIECLFQCAYRQGYLDSYKWQAIPLMGAASSLYVAAKITAASLSALLTTQEPPRTSIAISAVRLEISEDKRDLSVLFWNSISNIFTAGFLNATRIYAYKCIVPTIEKKLQEEPILRSPSEDYEVVASGSFDNEDRAPSDCLRPHPEDYKVVSAGAVGAGDYALGGYEGNTLEEEST